MTTPLYCWIDRSLFSSLLQCSYPTFCTGAHAAAEACGSVVLSFASVKASAKAIAQALAEATAQSYTSCSTDEGGYACADAGSYATDTAKAVAKVCSTKPDFTACYSVMKRGCAVQTALCVFALWEAISSLLYCSSHQP